MRWPAFQWIVVALACACSFDSSGTGAESGALGGSTTADGSTSFMPLPGTTSGPRATTVDDGGGDGGSTSTGDPTDTAADAETGEDTSDAQDTGAMTWPVSCAAILSANPNALSTLYMLDPSQGGRPVDVYCDMTTAGGGWTLVGRSANGSHDAGMFGWSASRGAPDDFSVPYSLDARGVGLAFTEILIGNRGEGVTWGSHVYRLSVPADFIDHLEDAVTTSDIETVIGDCDPDDGPSMLRRAGHTGQNDVFFFRDNSDFDTYGLEYDGFDMYWNLTFSCSNGADLDGDQGMIFVR